MKKRIIWIKPRKLPFTKTDDKSKDIPVYIALRSNTMEFVPESLLCWDIGREQKNLQKDCQLPIFKDNLAKLLLLILNDNRSSTNLYFYT